MKKYIDLLLSAFLAGCCIGIGGTVFLLVKDSFPAGNVVGALLFTIGLFTICTRGYHLFTGKVCPLFDNKPSYVIDLIIIWLGNLLGTSTIAVIMNLTRVTAVKKTAAVLVDTKMNDGYLSLFLLGIICNILIFIAADGYAKNPHELGKYLALFLGVSVFILCSTEHSIADMFYFAASGKLFTSPAQSFLRLFVITLGNTVGGVSFKVIEKLRTKLSQNATVKF